MFPKTKRAWLFFAAIGLLAVQVLALLVTWIGSPAQDPTWLSGFRGNVISNLLGGVFFLALALYLSDEMEGLQRETHALTKDRSARESQQLKIEQFMNFLRSERYHDARFPDLTTKTEPLGVDYTIEPVRDATGRPLQRVTEMEISYVVKVRSPSHPEVRDAENLADYQEAPIHTNEFYFCRFYNGDWHMGQDSIGWGWHRFYLSGKVGPVEHGLSANEFVNAVALPEGAEPFCRLLVKKDGTLMSGSGGAYSVDVYEAKDGALLVQFHDAPPKALRIERGAAGQDIVVIDHMEGYFPGSARENLLKLLAQQIALRKELHGRG